MWEALASVPCIAKQVSKQTALFRQAQQLMLVIPEFGRWRQKDQEFQVSLSCIVSWRPAKATWDPNSGKQTKTIRSEFTMNLSELWVCCYTLWTCKKERWFLGHFLHIRFIKINLCLQDFSASPYYENPQTRANPSLTVRISSQLMLCAADVTWEVCAQCVSLQPVSRVDAKSSPKLLMFKVVCIY